MELIVHMDCGGCESKIKKALQNLEGVDEVDVDMNLQKVTVMGWADQDKILKTVRRTGRKAEMWPYSPEYQHNATVVQQYYQQQHHQAGNDSEAITLYDSIFPIVPSNQFFQNVHDFGYYSNYQQQMNSTIVDDQATSMFSDDNPHACSIM
ncbi:heavy metal-associated isoprenylated plant protein 28-like isoform X2 [Humulus lupulus]|nr:heavy metal-associated isoprenylated plant protein 28-like isoform X2 [Humulus lupulus]